MILRKNKNSGFTLIETFVAIVVLMIAVLGPMTLLSRALKDSAYIRDEITATFLAQEGVEMMIDKRNNNQSILGGEDCELSLDNNSGYNCLDNGERTVFHRKIEIANLSPDPQIKITSTVTRTNFPGKYIVSSSIIFK